MEGGCDSCELWSCGVRLRWQLSGRGLLGGWLGVFASQGRGGAAHARPCAAMRGAGIKVTEQFIATNVLVYDAYITHNAM